MLDSFFGNVCELDLVFNFYKVRKQMAGYNRNGGGESGWERAHGGEDGKTGDVLVLLL